METLQLPLEYSDQEKLEVAFDLVSNTSRFKYFEYVAAAKIVRSFYKNSEITSLQLCY